jgi:SAM-dependent methyltransferase
MTKKYLITFVGIDRSPRSLARAREEAAKHGLSNVQFENRHIPIDDLSDSFDLIVSTQTLFQAEKDPGLPSLSFFGLVIQDPRIWNSRRGMCMQLTVMM